MRGYCTGGYYKVITWLLHGRLLHGYYTVITREFMAREAIAWEAIVWELIPVEVTGHPDSGISARRIGVHPRGE